MALLITEQIMRRVLELLDNLATTGKNVKRVDAWDIKTLPALRIIQGAEDYSPEEENTDFAESDLQFKVRIATETTDELETDLNQIRKEVYAAIMADNTLAMTAIHHVWPVGVTEPDIHEAETPYGFIEITFLVDYEHQYADASAVYT